MRGAPSHRPPSKIRKRRCVGRRQLGVATVAGLPEAHSRTATGTAAQSAPTNSQQDRTTPPLGWEVDVDNLKAVADKNTVAMVIVNPGNPCGNVYTYEHLAKVAETARKLGIFVIAR